MMSGLFCERCGHLSELGEFVPGVWFCLRCWDAACDPEPLRGGSGAKRRTEYMRAYRHRTRDIVVQRASLWRYVRQRDPMPRRQPPAGLPGCSDGLGPQEVDLLCAR